LLHQVLYEFAPGSHSAIESYWRRKLNGGIVSNKIWKLVWQARWKSGALFCSY